MDALPVVDFPEIHLVFVNQATQVFVFDHLTPVDPVLLGVAVAVLVQGTVPRSRARVALKA